MYYCCALATYVKYNANKAYSVELQYTIILIATKSSLQYPENACIYNMRLKQVCCKKEKKRECKVS